MFGHVLLAFGTLMCAGQLMAGPLFFSTGDPDGKMATASRPDVGGFEIESADDFTLTSRTLINSATFHGLLTGGATTADIGQVAVEIYRVFPLDSGPFSGNVPTRVNSPSDVAFDSRDALAGTLSVGTTVLSATFDALNSVQAGGIHPIPLNHTGGDGAVSGEEVLFAVTFTTPFDLPAGHYFFIPQVQVTGGDFLWLSAPKPIVAPGTPFLPDLQSWTRDQFLDPDWLRVGTDIVGGGPAPTFNAAFSLSGTAVPEPASWLLAGGALGGLLIRRRIRRS